MGISKVDRLPQEFSTARSAVFASEPRDSPRLYTWTGWCRGLRLLPYTTSLARVAMAGSKRSWAQHKHHRMLGWAFGKMPIPVHRPAMSPKMSLDLLGWEIMCHYVSHASKSSNIISSLRLDCCMECTQCVEPGTVP